MASPETIKAMKKDIYTFFKTIDPTGMNEKHYKELFETMTDAEFTTWFKGFFKDPKAYLPIHTVDYEANLEMEAIRATAKKFGIPLFEYVYDPHITMDLDNVVRTPEPVPTIFLNLKRTQQTVAHKNGLSTSLNSRSAITNQLVGDDKNGRSSDLENMFLVSMGLTNTLRELNGPRADDMVMKNAMQRDIAMNGYVSLNEMESSPENKTTLNTVNAYLLAMGIRSDLVTTGLMLKKTLKDEL